MKATLWDIVSEYVKDKHPHVPIDPDNSIAGGYRFRVWVLKNTIEISDAGASPGKKAPKDFPREVIKAADPDLFKKLSKICKYRGRGGVCVYRDPGRYGTKSVWTFIQGVDYTSMHGIDVETELIGGLAAKINEDLGLHS